MLCFAAIVSSVVLAVGTLGAIWWWAILGMSDDIGIAWFITDLCAFGVLCVCAPLDSDNHGRSATEAVDASGESE